MYFEYDLCPWNIGQTYGSGHRRGAIGRPHIRVSKESRWDDLSVQGCKGWDSKRGKGLDRTRVRREEIMMDD